MVDPTLPLPFLSPVAGKELVARFDGGRLFPKVTRIGSDASSRGG